MWPSERIKWTNLETESNESVVKRWVENPMMIKETTHTQRV